VAEALYQSLKAAGVTVWYDETSVPPGAAIDASIEAGVSQSRHVVVLLSVAALDSAWVSLEKKLALLRDPDGRHQTLIPVRLGDMPVERVPPLYRTLEILHLDVERNLAEVVEQLVATVRETSQPRVRVAQKPEEKPADRPTLAAKTRFKLGPFSFEFSFQYAATAAAMVGLLVVSTWRLMPNPTAMVGASPPPLPVPDSAAAVSPTVQPSQEAATAEAPPPPPDEPAATGVARANHRVARVQPPGTNRELTPRKAAKKGKALSAAQGTATCNGVQCVLHCGACVLEPNQRRSLVWQPSALHIAQPGRAHLYTIGRQRQRRTRTPDYLGSLPMRWCFLAVGVAWALGCACTPVTRPLGAYPLECSCRIDRTDWPLFDKQAWIRAPSAGRAVAAQPHFTKVHN